MLEKCLIRRYRASDPISPITRLLREAYAPLAAMGLRYTATYQDDSVTLSRLTRGVPFLAEIDGILAATVTLYPEASPESAAEWYRKEGVQYFGQFAVRPDLQRHGLGSKLVRLMEKEAARRGATELALDTAEPAYELRRWYERLGFRQVESLKWESTNYQSVILSKSLCL